MSSGLACRGLSVSYGGVDALIDFDVEVAPGELVGLIGPNGAGKTTCVDALSGFAAARGEISLDGRDLTRLAPHQRALAGLARTWQSIELFDDLSVRENLVVAASRSSAWDMTRELFGRRPDFDRRTDEALERLGLRPRADDMTADLSQGERKLVGVARALVAEPQIVCMDEPAAGLDSYESQTLGRQLRAIADAGTGILLIDHDMGLVLGISDRVVVLEFGRIIAIGSPQEIRTNERVIVAYLGAEAAHTVATELEAETAATDGANRG